MRNIVLIYAKQRIDKYILQWRRRVREYAYRIRSEMKFSRSLSSRLLSVRYVYKRLEITQKMAGSSILRADDHRIVLPVDASMHLHGNLMADYIPNIMLYHQGILTAILS